MNETIVSVPGDTHAERNPDFSYVQHPRMHQGVNELVFGQGELHLTSEPALKDKDRLTQEDAGMVRRLEYVRPKVQEFLHTAQLLITDKTAYERVRMALAMMLKLHLRDNDRKTGEPFAAHPLAVAMNVLLVYDKENIGAVVAAALLHDAVEDQAALFAIEHRANQVGIATTDISALRELVQNQADALKGLAFFIGAESSRLVDGVTTPLHDKKHMSQEDKNNIYFDWAQEIVQDKKFPERFVIKWSDWTENAFTLDMLQQRAQTLRDAGNTAEAESVEKLRAKLRIKYEPVLRRIVLPFLQNDALDGGMPGSHPLYAIKQDMRAHLEEVLRTQYV
jgi:hypothetical protein